MGTFMVSGKGTGKSRCVTRSVVWKRFLRGIGQVYIDPVGAGVLNFVDKLLRFSTRLPKSKQQELWQRFRVFRFSGDYLPGFPLYFRLGHESLYEVAQRFLEVIRRLDPHLQTASVEGWNPLYTTGTNVGMVLTSLGLPITEGEDLLLHPRQWRSRLQQAVQQDPEVAPVVRFFYDYMEWDARTRARHIASFMNKIRVFTLDPTMRAIFAAEELSFHLPEVREKGLSVFLDTSGIDDTQRKQFINMWLFQLVLNNIKHEGVGRREPWAFYVDELADVVNGTAGGDLLAADIQELADKWARNASVMYFFMSQHLHAQFSDTLVKTLLSSGNLVIGNISDMGDDARALVTHLFPYQANRVKHWQPVYSGIPPRVIDYTPVFFSPQEQAQIAAQAFRLAKFRFLFQAAEMEGSRTGQVQAMNLEGLDQGIWVDEARANPVIDLWAQRDRASKPVHRQSPEQQSTKSDPGIVSPHPPVQPTRTSPEPVVPESQDTVEDAEFNAILAEILEAMASEASQH
jgi:hypothetical protein